MKTRVLYSTIPIVLVALLIGFDFWWNQHLGILILLAGAGAGCVYEIGKGYSSQQQSVPYRGTALFLFFWLLLAGGILLYPKITMNWAGVHEGQGTASILLYGILLFPVLLLSMGIFLTGALKGPSSLHGSLIGLAFTVLFGSIFLHGVLLLHPFAEQNQDLGTLLVLFLIGHNKLCDTGAYAVGKTFGSHTMSPVLSPNKTWEGFAGALMTGVLVGFLFVWFTRVQNILSSVSSVLLFSIVFSLTGVLGDLTGSLLKRGAELDDSSSLLPGVGGIFDLSDCFFVTLPVAFFLLFPVL